MREAKTKQLLSCLRTRRLIHIVPHVGRLIVVVATLSMESIPPSEADVAAVMNEGVVLPTGCSAPALRLLLLIHTALLALSLLLEISMAWLAMQGTMWNVAPRRLMEHVLYGRLSNLHNLTLDMWPSWPHPA